MKKPLMAFGASLLTACGPNYALGLPTALTTNALGADVLGGLPTAEAAHASVEAASPQAFVLVPTAVPFLSALTRTVEPMRQDLAKRMLADPTISQGLKAWTRTSTAGQLAVLQRVAEIEADVMGCQVPVITAGTGAPPQSGMMAIFQPGNGDTGQITLYSDSIAKGGKNLAIATVVHEMRHAAQAQLVSADQAGKPSGDAHTLAVAYTSAWQTMDAWGGESQLAYGDYVHLAVEYDAFQTGNEVAAIVSSGAYDALGSGFIDVQYQADATPTLDLAGLMSKYTTRDLVGAVNLAEAQAMQTHANSIIHQPSFAGRRGGIYRSRRGGG